jgi:hypothetical protein
MSATTLRYRHSLLSRDIEGHHNPPHAHGFLLSNKRGEPDIERLLDDDPGIATNQEKGGLESNHNGLDDCTVELLMLILAVPSGAAAHRVHH